MNKLKLVAVFIFIIGIIITIYYGLEMRQLKLWGYRPLYFFVGVFATILAILMLTVWQHHKHTKKILLVLLSGSLLAAAFPPLPLSFLLFVAWLPLFYCLEAIEQDPDQSRKGLHAWLSAYMAFLLWNILVTWWVSNSALVPAIAAFTINSLFMTVPWMAMRWVYRINQLLAWPAFICFWICFEWLHQSWEISWPWLTLGNAFAGLPTLIQWYDITGTFGGSLWILLANGLIIWAKQCNWQRKKLYYTLAVLLIIPSSISLIKYFTVSLTSDPVTVSIVQPNYEPHYSKFTVDQELQIIQFEKLSRAAMVPNTEYLLWPETSFEYIRTDEFDIDWRMRRMKDLMSAYPQACLVTGIGSIKTFKEGEALTDAARQRSRFPGQYFEVQNSAIQICSSSDVVPIYLKSKLVPGPEIFPYKNILPFLKPIVDKLGGSVEGLGTQAERSVFDNGKHKIAPVICYESIYGNYIGDYIRKGAEAIFIMTNDGWWDDTPGYKQHLAYGALRAIEFRRPIARSANSGTSCFINARGDISKPSKYNTATALYEPVHFSKKKTLYYYLGDFIAWLALIVGMGFIFIFFRKNLATK